MQKKKETESERVMHSKTTMGTVTMATFIMCLPNLDKYHPCPEDQSRYMLGSYSHDYYKYPMKALFLAS